MTKNKTLAAWLALLGGSLGLHRAYVNGLRDRWWWLHPIPTAIGLIGLQRFRTLGQEDLMAAWSLPLLGLMLAQGALCAIVYGLTKDETWNARHNPTQPAAPTGWGPILAAIAALLVGGTVLMSAIVFGAQRYFELETPTASSNGPTRSIA